MSTDKTKMAYLLTSLGAIYGVYYGVTRQKSFLVTGIIALGFGLGGAFIGNKIDKMREEK